MKIAAVAYGLAFLLPPFFILSLAEPEIGDLKSFTTTNVQHVVVENVRDIENEHRLLQSGTCSNGLPGIESNAVCCPPGCGTCGGQGCRSRARSVGLTENDCCANRILDSGLYCSSEGAAPCIIDEGAPTPAPTPAPIASSTPAPVALSTPAPIASSTPAPIASSTPAPIALSTPAPVASSVPSDMQTLLDLHNVARCVHNAEPLVYSEEVEVTAQAYAEVLAGACGTFQHSEIEDRNFYGENLYMCWGNIDCYTPERAMYLFYDDEVQADSVLKYGGHATQILWKASTELGCALESCTSENVPYTYLVCHYNSPGNIIGQTEQQVELASRGSC